MKEIKKQTQARQFGIWAVVSGGVTGYRASWLKANGEVSVFGELEEAENEARRLNESMNNNFSRARFQYAAKEMI